MHLDDQVLFIHNPRASGTAIRRSLLLGADPNRRRQWPADLGKHAFAAQIKERIPAEVWNTRYKFAVVRNPWDRLVSFYGLFRRPEEPTFRNRVRSSKYPVKIDKLIRAVSHPSISLRSNKDRKKQFNQQVFQLNFLDWLEWCREYQWQACPYLGIRPMTAIPQSRWFDGLDRVFRFEDREEIDDFLRSRGYPVSDVENATEHRPWQSYYDNAAYDWVLDTFAEDIRRFGY